jgi:4-amino-4-deoxy-L-arabinose transferase-like glycosyltransferase
VGTFWTRGTLVVLAVALLARLGVFFLCVQGQLPRAVTPDSDSYQHPALNLLRHGTFTHYDIEDGALEPKGPAYLTHGGVPRVIATRGPYLPEVFRTPIYPAFLAGVYAVFGDNPLVAVFWQCLLGASACALVCFTGVRAGAPRAGFWGGLLLALDPGSALTCNLLITDTLYTWLLAVVVALLIAFSQRQRLAYLLAAGACVGLSVLCRPGGSYLPPLLAAWVLLASARPWRSRVVRMALFAAAVAVPVGPWLYRNYSTFGVWQVSSMQGLNLFFCKAADLESGALADGELSNAALRRLEEGVRPAIEERPRNQLEMAALYQDYAVRRIRQQPGTYAKLHVLGTAKMLLSHNVGEFYYLNGWQYRRTGLLAAVLEGTSAGGSSGAERRDPTGVTLALAETGWLLGLYVLAAVALMVAFRGGHRTLVALLLLVILYNVLTPGSQGIARFRLPAMPVIALMAGLGIERLTRSWSSRRAGAEAAGATAEPEPYGAPSQDPAGRAEVTA